MREKGAGQWWMAARRYFRNRQRGVVDTGRRNNSTAPVSEWPTVDNSEGSTLQQPERTRLVTNGLQDGRAELPDQQLIQHFVFRFPFPPLF